MSERKRKDRKLSFWLKRKLAEPAPMAFQDEAAMAEGEAPKLVGEVVADNVAREAMKGERWAIELAYDRTEGKPIQAVKDDGADKSVEERLDDVTRHHLNKLAERIGAGDAAAVEADADPVGVGAVEPREPDRERDERGADAGDDGAGTVRDFLDLPRDGDHDSENPQSEP